MEYTEFIVTTLAAVLIPLTIIISGLIVLSFWSYKLAITLFVLLAILNCWYMYKARKDNR